MSTKANTHAEPKGGKKHPAKQQGAKKKRAKSSTGKGKGRGSQPSELSSSTATTGPNAGDHAGEKVVHEVEPAGEDDHAFFDNEENEGYAKFMLSLEESALPTFSKRAKDRVAVAPTSKKKRGKTAPSSTAPDNPDGEQLVPQPAIKQVRAAALSATKEISASATVAAPEAADAPTKKRHEAVVDAKRRKASTAGWVEDDPDRVARLPIKTKRGILKPNERMEQQQTTPPTPLPDRSSVAQPTAAALVSGDSVTNGAAGGGNQMDVGGDGKGHPNMDESDDVSDLHMSDDVYDSADSDDEGGHDYGPALSDGTVCARVPNGSSGDGIGRGGVDLVLLKERRFLQKKMLMAELCESILGAPEESLKRPKVVPQGEDERSRMEQLFSLVEDDDHRVRYLALLSQYAVFKDIIPGYRIRVPTTAELATKVSKEVQRVRGQEAALLNAYQQYLKALEATVQAAVSSGGGGASATDARSLASSAIRCMCGLLSAHPHFNFRSNLVRIVVAGTDHKLSEVREACCRCLGDVFTDDVQGEVSLEVTKAVAKYIKERKFQVSEGTIRCLAALPLRIREDERARAKARVKSKNRKRRRDGSAEAGLMEADANVDDDLRAKCQADALHEVMLTYFRVLKRRPPPPSLFPAVMEGLAKFVHLVNLDTVQDLLDLLKDLLNEEEGEDELPLQPALHCILAAFRALQGPGRELQTDEAAFVSALYRRLPDLLRPENGEADGRKTASCVALVYDSLDAALGKRKELSIARVVAMIKRLLSVSLQLTQSADPTWGAGAGSLLRGAHRLLLRYPAAQQLLENEQDRPGAGPHRPDLPNPEHANALSSAAWELSLLRHSCEPAIGAVVRDVVALGSQDAASALTALHERGREAREAGAGQGTLAAAFTGVPLPEARAVALGKMGVLEGVGGEGEIQQHKKQEGGGGKGQQKKRVVPKVGVDTKSPLWVRLARAGGDCGSG